MKKYEKAQMEVIEFENEDVIATSVGICNAADTSISPWEPGHTYGGEAT